MSWKTALPLTPVTAPPAIPDIEVVPGLVRGSRRNLAAEATDLLVIPTVAGFRLPYPGRLIDESLNGALSEAAHQAGFDGRLGQTLLFDPCGHGLSAPQKHILLLGIGPALSFDFAVCCVSTLTMLKVAKQLQARSLVTFVPAHRTTRNAVSLFGLSRTMRCRLEAAALQGELGSLETFKVFCSPAASPYLQRGLSCGGPRCQACHPAL